MKIPILVSGTPSSLVDGRTCKVYLHHGQWKIVSENLVDSQFFLVLDDGISQENIITGPCELLIQFNTPGNETNLNIYATNDG